MPELPDVEGFKRLLVKTALGKRIDRVSVHDARILGKGPPRSFIEGLEGASFAEARRHGKHIAAAGWHCISG